MKGIEIICEILKAMIIIGMIITMIITIAFIIFNQQYEGEIGHFYPSKGIIIVADYEKNYITIKDYQGNILKYTTTKDWTVGRIVQLMVNDNNTETTDDDYITDIDYGGWII